MRSIMRFFRAIVATIQESQRLRAEAYVRHSDWVQ